MRAALTVGVKLNKTQPPINLEVTDDEVTSVNLGAHALCLRKWACAIRPSRCIVCADR
jgi:hypothetical protein